MVFPRRSLSVMECPGDLIRGLINSLPHLTREDHWRIRTHRCLSDHGANRRYGLADARDRALCSQKGEMRKVGVTDLQISISALGGRSDRENSGDLPSGVR